MTKSSSSSTRDWQRQARSEQLAPDGGWRIWLFLGGRGAGKTRSGAQWIAEGVANRAMHHIGLVGATYGDARAVMIEGVSGLLAAADGAAFEPSNRRVVWPGGAIATVLSADEPDGIRGHQFDTIWGDEFAKWSDPQTALDMALMSLRIGTDPRLALTTTPRNIAALRSLLASPDVAVTRSTTSANAENLAPGFLETMERRYAGSRLGRQELDAELIEDNDAALWRRSWIEDHRVRSAPDLAQIVVAVDPAASAGGRRMRHRGRRPERPRERERPRRCGGTRLCAGRPLRRRPYARPMVGARRRRLRGAPGRCGDRRGQSGRRDGARRAAAERAQPAADAGARDARQGGARRAGVVALRAGPHPSRRRLARARRPDVQLRRQRPQPRPHGRPGLGPVAPVPSVRKTNPRVRTL
ncbi:MAG: terminase family protein [Rhizomicrobium sp.]